MQVFPFVLIFVIIPVITAPLGFPFGVFFNLFFRYKKSKKDDGRKQKFTDYLSEGYADKYREISGSIKTKDKLTLTAEYFDFGFKKTVIFVPGYRNSPYLNFGETAKKFIEKGFNVLMTHQRAYGKKVGLFCGVGLKEQYDLLQWVDWLDLNTKSEAITIYGVSMGASTVAFASDKITNQKVKTLIIDSAYSSFYDMLYLSASKANKIIGASTMKVAVCLSKWLLKIDIKTQISDSLKNNKIPAVFLIGEEDKTVPVSFLEKAYYNNSSDKILLLVPGAAHIKSFEVGGDEVQGKIFSFIEKVV